MAMKYRSPGLSVLRQPAKYWVVSDAQLKRDLKGRTLADVYRDNHTGRMGGDGHHYSPRFGKYEPRTMDGPNLAHGPRMRGQTLLEAYLGHCAARNHEPHPASLDSDHPHNCHREKCPPRDYGFGIAIPELREAA